MRKICSLILLIIGIAMCSGCAVTLPTDAYTPQNYVRTSGKVDIGNFTYVPFLNGKKVKKPNQIENTAAGSLYISTEVANFVKRVTALELEKSGVVLDTNAPLRLDANVLEFKADDLGYSVDWSYKVQYKLIDKATDTVVYDKSFAPPIRKGGKFGEAEAFTTVASETVLSGYDLFIRDLDVQRLLKEAALPPTAKNIKK